jgi:hypothetical protein
MNGALFRLFLRRSLAWDLFVVVGLARIVSVLCEGAASIWLATSEPGAGGNESGPALLLHLALLSGVAVGLLASAALQDMGYCRFTWTLPGYGRALRRELTLLAGATTTLSAVGFALFGGNAGLVVPPALTLLGFGLGTLLRDTRVGKAAGPLAATTLIGLLILARPLAPLAEDWAMAPLVAGLALSAYGIRRSTSRRALLARALTSPAELGAEFQPAAGFAPHQLSALAASKGWAWGRVVTTRDWMLAVLFENGGWLPGGWLKRSFATGLGVSTLTSFIIIVLGRRHGGTWSNGLAWIPQAVFDPRARLTGVAGSPPENLMALGFAATIYLLILGTRQDLRRGALYPISRRVQTHAVWRAGLAHAGTGVAATGLGFSIFGVVGLLASGADLPYRRVPDIITVMLLCITLQPVLLWFRVRYLEFARGRVSPTAYSAGCAISLGAFAGAVALFAASVRRADPGLAAVLTYVTLPAAFLFVEYLYFRWLAAWFGRVDLA